MVLTAEDRRLLQASVAKLGCRLEDIGADALNRLFLAYPQTKIYFSHFNLSPGSKDIVHQGEKVGTALDSALKNLDDIRGPLSQLSDLHAYNLRVDPGNFELLSKCIHVSLATDLRNEYTASTFLAWDKFLEQVADILCENCR
ncbi:PREDICTED: hemoglobin subunit alpha-D-like [Thamnophis sirtalis]|uniref:Hemoglobin subunit alpha-D-like n=1 Tax=Thamnophis sirtalis TaxID=35019 RepID=A0A6I9Y5L2_9SAUR|nr:PREDICTED: hemoglobin subunit alpha-D-like [Thamnophis sirtalis]